MYSNDPIWTCEPEILYRGRRLSCFIPLSEYTEAERFNAMTRFFLLLGLVLVIYRRSFAVIIPCCILPILLMVLLSEFLLDTETIHEDFTPEPQTSTPQSSKPDLIGFTKHLMTPIS